MFSSLVASIIQDKPLLSITVSVVVTTGLLGLRYRPIKRNWEASSVHGPEGEQPAANAPTA